jgi:3-hydroxymyristoyl/3-hydroxydecanoyl-(acyl carrier protein) dehydratase
MVSVEPIPADHPCLPGHFPGNPIVPGTLLLQRVIEGLALALGEQRVCEVVSAKFLYPLKPEQAFSVRFQAHGETVEFECRREETRLASGKLKLIHSKGLE